MKIEKLNENQIRCTLTHADLAARHLKLSELAYGTEKAKSLLLTMDFSSEPTKSVSFWTSDFAT